MGENSTPGPTSSNADLAFRLIAVDLLFEKLNAVVDNLERITKMQAWLLDRYAKHLLEHGIHEEIDRAEAEQKRREKYYGGGFRPEAVGE